MLTHKEVRFLYRPFYEFVAEMDTALRPEKNFDLVKRELILAGRPAYLYFIDGFIKDEVYEKMLEFLFAQTAETLSGIETMDRFRRDKMPYIQADATESVEVAVTAVLTGPAVLVIGGISGALIINTRKYPTRSIEEPQKDKSLRGSRDGFVENIQINAALIRRRIRTENLRIESQKIGKRTKLDIAVVYIDGLVDPKQLNALKKRLETIRLNGISMTQQAFCEALIPTAFCNPYPKFKFTERPDYASACVLDGKIVILLDNSPAVMVLPNSFADFFRDVDDYYFMPAVGTYTRIIRLLVSLLTVLAVPVYLLAVSHPEIMPPPMRFMLPKESAELPLFWQLLILEFIVDGLQLASLNTPDTLSNSLGIIGGLLLSEFAITAGWFIPEAVLCIAFVTIAAFAQPSFEMGYAMKFERIFLMISVQLLDFWGLCGAVILLVIGKIAMKTVSGHNYLYPIVPFNRKAFIRMFLRPGIRDKGH